MRYDSRRALELLRFGIGRGDAEFREGQEHAIRHVVEGRGRLLVVQKTGWGKSFVYFIATKLLRESGAGLTLLVSPLLALMRNQSATAERMGIQPDRVTTHPCRRFIRLRSCSGPWIPAFAGMTRSSTRVLPVIPAKAGIHGFHRN